ncbi:multiple sugar transport system permease protein/alpha-1,4-digalacturonate transport system permease protein [Kribbella sp. VKM Ac-2527]|uniref:Multiple sugar transport system permease protein/alpha-1,4-digalacturonate transport system permease protein n=1 Tax=Kribbella caucasensis TaxID=2512215 RepID=A0A4R6JF67_9ACTN|nr:sugar ABC transporter permease [Kribbella sp. VKM Ac-2527]TDO33256.1 multiple sugar transport system permease protein/alpha-1,4-digalacturonate transport system permease protein [Kribbella sp. VKM Ac-2527]
MAVDTLPTTSIAPPQTKPVKAKRERNRETLTAWLFLLPSFIGFVIFTAGPVVAAGVISLLDWNLFSPPTWAGLRNFARLGPDPTFWSALGNTVYFTFVSVPLTIVVSLALALLLNQGVRRIAVFRSLLLLPYATITVAVAFVWIWLYIPHDGLVNAVLGLVGINGPDWLISDTWAMPALIAMTVWKSFGFGMVVFLAGLQAIPQQLYEAAKVDGSSAWQRFRNVTVPMLSPALFFVVVTSIIGSFQVFDQAFVMTHGGPGSRTTTLVMYIYRTGFESYDQGYAAAQSLVLFAFIVVITAAQFLMQRRLVHYDN